MNKLFDFFINHPHRECRKWTHYFNIYDTHFHKYIGKSPVILEIGIDKGGSLQMWKNYFGEGAKIYGVDINPECKNYEEEQIEIFIGSQEDENFLNSLKNKIGPIDILIDDGSHIMEHQILTFNTLYDAVKENGIYLCEDTHTSYWAGWNGGYKKPDTFIEYSKNFIDELHAWYCDKNNPWEFVGPSSNYTTTMDSIHWYDSIVVFQKQPRVKPEILTIGY